MANHLYDALFADREASDAPFLYLTDGTTLTHRAFTRIVGDLSITLSTHGVLPGDRVAAQVDKSPTALALYAACLRLGAVFLPLNTAYTDDEVGFFLADCEASILFCDPVRADALGEVAGRSGTHLVTLAEDGSGSWRNLSDRWLPPTVACGPDDLAAILYTSGTTGRPKGAMLSHDNLLSNARTLVELWGFTDTDTLLHALPVYHSHGLFVACNVCLLAGARMVYLPRFDTDAVVAALPGCTVMMGVPTFYTRLLAASTFTSETTAHMRLFISGSAPLLVQTQAAFETRTGHRILERYGLTETSMNTSNPLAGARKHGTVGRHLTGVELRLGPGDTDATGEIEVRGPNVFQGYWGLPDKTSEAFTPDGWFKTGDLGTIDADGYLTIVGRSKDLIISGGLNIYPKEIETILDAQPGVGESAVIGLPDPDFGERVVAVVTQAGDGSVEVDRLSDALADRLARFKHPRRIVVVENLPRNAMGKVQKRDLRDMAEKLGW